MAEETDLRLYSQSKQHANIEAVGQLLAGEAVMQSLRKCTCRAARTQAAEHQVYREDPPQNALMAHRQPEPASEHSSSIIRQRFVSASYVSHDSSWPRNCVQNVQY